MQLSHEHFNPEASNKEIILVCDHIQSPANLGSLFRLADAFAINEIIFYGTTPPLASGRFKKTARSTESSVRFRESKNIINTIQSLKEKDYTTLALELTTKSFPIQNLEIQTEKLVLIIGNERDGVEKSILEHTDHHLHINMFGKNSSMNVAQATAVAFYELTRK